MTPDSNGILYLEETDPITPFQTTINTLQAATSDAIGDFIYDTGWQNITFASGYTSSSGTLVGVRRIGPWCFLRGLVTPTSGNFVQGSTVTSVLTIPPEFRPAHNWYFAGAHPSSAASVTITVATTGDVGVRCSSGASNPSFAGLYDCKWTLD